MENTHFSILIPTRERCETLKFAIQTCLNQTYKNLSIIVSDNCSEDDTEAVVRSFSDSRLRYVKTPKRVSMSENFEFALSHVTTGFVMVIGDDDGVLPNALERVDEIIRTHRVKAIVSGIASYAWPNHPSLEARNTMSWSLGNAIELRSSKVWLQKVLTFDPLYTFDLPGLYCSFVDISLVRSMTSGSVYFRSQTPDAYSAFASAFEVESYAYSQRPYVIHGASGRSNGASYLSKKKTDGKEASSFVAENTIPFHPSLKVCPSFRMIAAESFQQLKDTFPEKTRAYEIDHRQLLRNVLKERNEATSKAIDDAVAEVCAKHGLSVNELEREPVLSKTKRFFQKIVFQFWRLRYWSSYARAYNLDRAGILNIEDASKALALFLDLNDRRIASTTKMIVINRLRGQKS